MLKIFRDLGFGVKILVTVLVLFLISMGAMAALTYDAGRDLLTEEMENEALNLAQSQAENINHWLNTRVAEVATLAQLKEIRSMDWDQQLPILTEHHTRLVEYYELLYVVDREGICRQTSGAVNNIADRDYFQEAMQGKTLVSDPVISKSTGNAIAIAIVPIKDANGDIVGALGGVVHMDTIKEIVQNCKLGETGYAYLVQQDGLTICHPQKEWELEQNLLQEQRDNQEMYANLTRMAKGETGLGYYTLDNIHKLISFAPVPLANWSLAITVPTEEIQDNVRVLLKTTLLVGIICLLLVAAAIVFISRIFVRPIQALTEMSGQVAEGDLTHVVTFVSQDEIGQLGGHFNSMVQHLKDLIQQIMGMTRDVVQSTEELATAAAESGKATDQVARTMQELAQGTANEAEMTQETVQEVNEMTQALDNVEKRAQKVGAVSQDFQQVVGKGMEAVLLLGNQMEQSVQSTDRVEQAIRELNIRSQEIGQIVEVITNIAGQTNLLALNAAIEDARAGEQGRGFAVVADEVRKLAEGSAQAAQQIAQIIHDIQNSTEVAVNETAVAKNMVQSQAEAVDTAEKLFREIENGVETIEADIDTAIVAVNQMAKSVQRIVRSVESISAITQQSAASTEQVSAITEEQTASAQMIASSAQEIASMVNELQNTVQRFKI